MMNTPPRIAIPMPHSFDPEYAERAIPQYEHAVVLAGGEPVRIPLNLNAAEIGRIMEGCQAVLLPGSKADVEPTKFNAAKSPHTAAADPAREAADELLLADAFSQRKPVLGICYGLQSLNVYLSGSLIQHIPDFLPEGRRGINHDAGKKIAVAHTVEIDDFSLAKILTNNDREGHGFSRADVDLLESRALAPEGGTIILPVNSSHHQSADSIGDGLRIVARCPDDGIIEALEGTSPDHFVLAVQWHPERSVALDEASRAIFRAFVTAAGQSD